MGRDVEKGAAVLEEKWARELFQREALDPSQEPLDESTGTLEEKTPSSEKPSLDKVAPEMEFSEWRPREFLVGEGGWFAHVEIHEKSGKPEFALGEVTDSGALKVLLTSAQAKRNCVACRVAGDPERLLQFASP